MEELGKGGFYIYDNGNLKFVEVKLKEVLSVHVNAEGKSSREVEDEILSINDFEDKILLLRVSDVLREGKSSDINFNVISDKFRNSFAFLKNTTKLSSKEFVDLEVKEGDVVEEEIIKDFNLDFNEEFVINLMKVLDKEKDEGEKNADFERRLLKELEYLN